MLNNKYDTFGKYGILRDTNCMCFQYFFVKILFTIELAYNFYIMDTIQKHIRQSKGTTSGNSESTTSGLTS